MVGDHTAYLPVEGLAERVDNLLERFALLFRIVQLLDEFLRVGRFHLFCEMAERGFSLIFNKKTLLAYCKQGFVILVSSQSGTMLSQIYFTYDFADLQDITPFGKVIEVDRHVVGFDVEVSNFHYSHVVNFKNLLFSVLDVNRCIVDTDGHGIQFLFNRRTLYILRLHVERTCEQKG
jgi:hypothetical protein